MCNTHASAYSSPPASPPLLSFNWPIPGNDTALGGAFGVWGLGFGVWGLGFGVLGFGFFFYIFWFDFVCRLDLSHCGLRDGGGVCAAAIMISGHKLEKVNPFYGFGFWVLGFWFLVFGLRFLV